MWIAPPYDTYCLSVVLLVWFNGLGCLCSGFLGCFVGVLFVVVGLVWLGEVFVTCLVGCWSRLAPPLWGGTYIAVGVFGAVPSLLANKGLVCWKAGV